VARLAGTSVDAEVILHSPTPPAGFSVVAEAGALAGYPHRERIANPFPERAELGPRQRAGSTKRVDARPPERLVGVDVSHAGSGPLVEERGFDGCAPRLESRSERLRGEFLSKRLFTETLRQVRDILAGLEQEPGAEAADVSVGDVRSVV
jgi:hypothetical protein